MTQVFQKVVLPVFGVFGTLLTLLTFVFPDYAHIKIDLYVYLITIFFAVIIISTFIMLLINEKIENKSKTQFNNFSIKPIQYVHAEKIFLISKEIDLPLNLSLSIYLKNNLYEKIIGLGYLSHVQPEFNQVKIYLLTNEINLSEYLNDTSNLQNIAIKPSSNVNEIITSIRGEN